jgi:hypothetical protein
MTHSFTDGPLGQLSPSLISTLTWDASESPRSRRKIDVEHTPKI